MKLQNTSYYFKIFLLIITIIFLLLSLLLTLQFTEKASKQASQQTLEHFARQKIAHTLKKEKIPGMSVLMMQHEKVVLNQGFGFKNLEKHQIATKHTQYEIASDTKAFTALAILQLSDEKKIDIKAPVTDYLPWLKLKYEGQTQKITIEQLLAQTSGIDDNMSSDIETSLSKDKDNLEDHVHSINHETLKSKPGQHFNYANMNYNILGLVVQNATSQSYESYVRQNILNPLHMNQTYFKTEAPTAKQKRQLATGYVYEHGRTKPNKPAYFKGDTPAAYMISSTNDMIPWINYQLAPEKDRKIVEQSHQKESETPDDPNATQYAKGWFLNPKDNQILHPGTLPNYSSFVLLDTKDKNGVVILANMNSEGVPKLAQQLNHQLSYFDQYHGLNHTLQTHTLIISIVIWAMSLVSILCLVMIAAAVYQFKQSNRHWRYHNTTLNGIIIAIVLASLITMSIMFINVPGWIIPSINWETALLGFSLPLLVLILISFVGCLLLTLAIGLNLLWKKQSSKNFIV